MADLANVDAGGKLNIIGVFSRFNPANLPHSHPLMFLVATCMFHPSETSSQRALRIEIVNPDGGIVFQVGPIGLSVPPPQRAGSEIEVPLVMQINDLKLETEGPHKVVIMLDSDVKGEFSFAVELKEKKN